MTTHPTRFNPKHQTAPIIGVADCGHEYVGQYYVLIDGKCSCCNVESNLHSVHCWHCTGNDCDDREQASGDPEIDNMKEAK